MSINSTPNVFAALLNIRKEKKFIETDFYPGAPTEEIRSRCEARVNVFLDGVMLDLRSGAQKQSLIERVRKLLLTFKEEDTEEREKVGDYVGEAMRTIGIVDWVDLV